MSSTWQHMTTEQYELDITRVDPAPLIKIIYTYIHKHNFYAIIYFELKAQNKLSTIIINSTLSHILLSKNNKYYKFIIFNM